MSLHFDCRACGTQHPSRLRIEKPYLVRVVMGAFGEVLEPCPLTGRWVPVRSDDLHWTDKPELSPPPAPLPA
jgi:hypothetical protein